MKDNKFYLIREDVLPESVIKTLKVKALLNDQPALSIYDAVKRCDLSRSAYYKYKDTIFPVENENNERNVTLLLYIDDKVGVLSRVLEQIAMQKSSVMTIHQSIPMNDKATITLSLNVTQMNLTINGLIELLTSISGVNLVQLLGMNM